MHFVTTHCWSKVLIDSMESMTFFNNLDLTRWAAWGYLLSTGTHKYYLPSGVNCVVFGNSTGKIGKVLINGVKRGGVDVAWTLILRFWGVTQEWISSAFEMFTLSWSEALPLCWRGWDVIGGFEIVIHDVWFAQDDNTGFLSVGLDFLIDYICKSDQYPCPWCQWVLKTKNMVNNIMWEELTKIEICAIFNEESKYYVCDIPPLWNKSKNSKLRINMFWWMMEIIFLIYPFLHREYYLFSQNSEISLEQ